MMQCELQGSLVKVYKLHRDAAPSGGLIAMMGTSPAATAVKEGDNWTLNVDGEEVATFKGNTTAAALALHIWFLGYAKAVREAEEARDEANRAARDGAPDFE